MAGRVYRSPLERDGLRYSTFEKDTSVPKEPPTRTFPQSCRARLLLITSRARNRANSSSLKTRTSWKLRCNFLSLPP